MKILIIDDQETICIPIAEKLERHLRYEFDVVPLFSLAEAIPHLASDPPPRLVLLDLKLVESDGLETLNQFNAILKQLNIRVPVAIFSAVEFQTDVGADITLQAINEYGVRGILPKHAKLREIFVGLGRLLEGEIWIPENVLRALLWRRAPELSAKEEQCATHIAAGIQNSAIAQKMSIDSGSAQRLVQQTLGKVGIKHRTYVSYSWEGFSEKLLDSIVQTLPSHIELVRDRQAMEYGASITSFMKEIANGPTVLVLLDQKYLESAFCMHELLYIYHACQGDRERWQQKVVSVVDQNCNFSTIGSRQPYVDYWKKRLTDLDTLIERRTIKDLGEADRMEYLAVLEFISKISDLLFWVSDTLRPRSNDGASVVNWIDLPPITVPTELRKSGIARLIDVRGG